MKLYRKCNGLQMVGKKAYSLRMPTDLALSEEILSTTW